jgi:hypothetical protein
LRPASNSVKKPCQKKKKDWGCSSLVEGLPNVLLTLSDLIFKKSFRSFYSSGSRELTKGGGSLEGYGDGSMGLRVCKGETGQGEEA